jgi:hypothetical protein
MSIGMERQISFFRSFFVFDVQMPERSELG